MNEMRIRVEELFHEVADLPAEERERFFKERNINAQTRREVEDLVAFDSRSSTSLERDIARIAGHALAGFELKALQCGPYRVEELLGRGGMGTVYAAERVDGEVAQRVAVKLLRPGADNPSFRQRFLAERQILATLSHPNIAGLLDAGHREDGQPYLVMEYVEGKPIDIYIAGLGTRQKVTLFLQVCAAVAYLHRNLVVHRDLKPSNIMVNHDGEAKLLDFGIAKMLDLTADETMTGMRLLTPEYASPEQVTGGPVTTATDIYSLGAVLYKLLTGVAPHQVDRDSGGAIVSAVSSREIAPPSKRVPALKGDIEMILLKALRREPQERYATIDQFSEDLEKYLQSRPIRARRGDAWYRTRKFLRRYWLPVAATTLAVAGLSAGVLVANHQRSIAQRRFVQVRQLANKLFDIDAEVRKTPGTTKARQLIVDTSLEYLRRLSVDVQADPGLALEIGNAYMRVARVQGVPIAANLGQMEQAERNLLIAQRFVDSVLIAQPANRIALLRAAQISSDRMILARENRGPDAALSFARLATKSLEKFHAGKSDTLEGPTILNTYVNVADQFMLAEQFEEALRLCRQAKDIARDLNLPASLGSVLFVSADVSRRKGDLDEALQDIRESVKILDLGPGDTEQSRIMNLVLALINEGRILGEDRDVSMGRFKEAEQPLQRAFNIADEFVHRDPNDQNSRGRLAISGIVLADILRHSDATRSIALYDHVLRHISEVKNNLSFRRYEVGVLAGSSYSLLRLGRTEEARHRIDAAFERLRQLNLYPAERIDAGVEVDKALSARADYEASRGRSLVAIGIYEELLRKVMSAELKPDTSVTDAFNLARIYAAIANLEHGIGRSGRAAEFRRRRLKLWAHWDAELPNNNFVRRQLSAANEPFRESGDPARR